MDYNNVYTHGSLGALAPAECTNCPCQGHMNTKASVSDLKTGSGSRLPKP